MKKQSTGLTLIEVMIVVIILGILASIAIPSYQNYVIKGKRSQARATVLNVAQMEERYYTNNYAYYAVSAVPPATEPNGWNNYVGNVVSARTYDIAVSSVPPSTAYVITATPVNGFQDAECGSLTLDNRGSTGSAKGSAAPCW
jgi:type IV pilus assembly protein PilE